MAHAKGDKRYLLRMGFTDSDNLSTLLANLSPHLNGYCCDPGVDERGPVFPHALHEELAEDEIGRDGDDADEGHLVPAGHVGQHQHPGAGLDWVGKKSDEVVLKLVSKDGSRRSGILRFCSNIPNSVSERK